MGSRVVRACTQGGGFSPGVAARLGLADGRRLFLKAVSRHANPDAPDIYRKEARIAAALPPQVPAPKFLWSAEAGPWIALAFEEVSGANPRIPWRPSDLHRVLAALDRMARALTPSPLRLPSVARAHETTFRNWRVLRSCRPGSRATSDLGPWVQSHHPELARLEGRWGRASAGGTLVHFDVRADNVVLSPRRVWFVDWPWACLGAPWIDLLAFLPSVAMQGGPPPWELFDAHPLARGVPPEHVDAGIASLAGLFLSRGRRPPPPGLPNLRPFQWAQGQEAVRWLYHRWEGEDPGRTIVPTRAT